MTCEPSEHYRLAGLLSGQMPMAGALWHSQRGSGDCNLPQLLDICCARCPAGRHEINADVAMALKYLRANMGFRESPPYEPRDYRLSLRQWNPL